MKRKIVFSLCKDIIIMLHQYRKVMHNIISPSLYEGVGKLFVHSNKTLEVLNSYDFFFYWFKHQLQNYWQTFVLYIGKFKFYQILMYVLK